MTGRLRQDIEVEVPQRIFNVRNFFWRALNGSWITTVPRPANWKAIHFFNVCDKTIPHSAHTSAKEPISDFVVRIHTQIRELTGRIWLIGFEWRRLGSSRRKSQRARQHVLYD